MRSTVRTKAHRGALALALCGVVAASSTTGCSAMLVDGPPPNAANQRMFSCTTSNTWPTTDVVLAGLSLLEGVGALTDGTAATTNADGSRSTDYAVPVVFAAGAALFAASAMSGYNKTAACRQATGELMTRLYPGAQPGFAPVQPTALPAPQAPYDPWVTPPPGRPLGGPPSPAAPPSVWTAPALPPPVAPAPRTDDEQPQ